MNVNCNAVLWNYRADGVERGRPVSRSSTNLSKKGVHASRGTATTRSVPSVAAQAERFRQRLGFWTARVRELRELE